MYIYIYIHIYLYIYIYSHILPQDLFSDEKMAARHAADFACHAPPRSP